MRKLLLTFLLVLPFLLTKAQQGVFEYELWNALTQKENQDNYYRVRILLADQVDLFGLSATLDAIQATRDERIRAVVSRLQEKASATQGPLLHELATYNRLYPEDLKFYQPYWIANLVVVDAKPFILLELASKIEGIALINRDLDLEFTTDPVSIDTVQYSPNAVGAAEIGLRRIKSDSLWARGYTGKGRLGMIIDSGTMLAHPALSARWRGNSAPVSQSWLGPGTTPNECGGNHGTHVMGIMMGLDPATNDTIGSAVEAQWITAAGIGCAGGPSTTAAFQWSLNPDGDTNTTADVPDVVNNSWGGGTGQTSQCNGSYVPVFNALEAAGLAVIFSAGNSGPNASTITSPKNINTNVVNVFCVGNVNGNNASLPIANSSSRGPSVCSITVEPPLLIKPEVSAPGSSVRSSIGTSGYGNFTGTSMAAPHVSGGFLLLKEAFPNVPGSEILRAIYFTATDLGTPGEDNTFGRGIANMNAAFLYLSQNHTPATPQGGTYNIKAETIEEVDAVLCDDSLRAKLVVYNIGDSLIQGMTITAGIVGEPTQQVRWTGNLSRGQRDTLALPTIPVPPSPVNQTLAVRIQLDSGVVETDTLNNRIQRSYRLRLNTAAPFSSSFESGSLANLPFYPINPDNGIGWATNTASGLPNSLFAATVNCYAYANRGQLDHLETSQLQLPASGTATLSFYVAHAQNSGSNDSLLVSVSTDCGNSFTTVYADGGQGLATVSPRTTSFVPVQASDWKRIDIPLTAFVGMGKAVVRFTVKNDFGNNIYIDRLNYITSATKPLSDFSVEIDSSCAPMPVRFSAQSINATSLSWNIHGNATSSSNPVVTLPSGQVPVTLIATNANGNDTLSYQLTIPNNPVPFFNVVNDTVLAGQLIPLVNLSQFSSSYNWDFGDGTTALGFTPQKSYTDTGWYTITLSAVSRSCSITYTESRAVYIFNPTLNVFDAGFGRLRVYPNPAKSEVVLEADAPFDRPIQLRDLQGRICKTYTTESSQRIRLRLDGISTGMYVLEIPGKNGLAYRKLVVE